MSDIHDVLKELQKTYLSTMGDKVTMLKNLWQAQKWALLETEYHKLKGTGRTYGFPEVSQLGEAIERVCKSGKRPLIDIAVPLSLELLVAIQKERSQGTELKIEAQPAFKKVQDLLTQLKAS